MSVWLKDTSMGTDSSWSLSLTVCPAGHLVGAKYEPSHSRSGPLPIGFLFAMPS